MEFKVLGPLEVSRDGRAVALGGGKPRALLAFLLLHANEPVGAERLAGALWGENAPPGAVATVRVHVSRLRKAFGEERRLTTGPAGYGIRVQPGELDAERFERLLDDGRRALTAQRAEEASELLRGALGLWRGPPLADLTFEQFAQVEIARLEELRLAALELRVDADLAAGRHAELVPELQRVVAQQPLREHLHCQLMLALYRGGRQADALVVYRHARTVLVEQLGIEPGGELRALERAVLAHDPELMLTARDAAARQTTPGRESTAGERLRVPLPPTRTVGRDAALARLQAVVSAGDGRLVTVVGAGGVGKTRVAIELARRIGPKWRDGAVFVSLAALAAPEHVASTIAREFGVTPAPSEAVEDALVRHLARRAVLLVLDNFEHVLDAAALVADLVTTAPELTVLATSREPLRLRAERLFHLDPLPVTPEDGAPEAAAAVALFVAAVQARDPAFALSESNLPAVTEVCRRLDGLPLAIELAAARVGLLSVSELAARLRTGVDALDAGPRDAPSRQRTLTATLEWSYRLLDSHEQDVVVALAVFAGGCTLDAAEVVADAALEVFESLLAKNLVLAQPGPDGSRRLTMLETVRAFARARLEQRRDADALRRRHCEYYLALAERTQPELERTASPALVAELDRELDNMRAAFAWALGHAAELALRIASASAMYWHATRLKSEAAQWLASALALPEEAAPVSVRAAALQHYAINLETSSIEQAERAARESLELRRSLNDLSGCARSTWVLAHVLTNAYRPRDAYLHAGEALRLADAAGDRQARVWALATMALTAPTVREALRLGAQAADAYRTAGNLRELAGLQSSLAYTALIQGDHAAAEPLSREALDTARAYGDPFVLALAEGNAGLAALFSGATGAAQRAFVNELRLGIDYGFDSEYAGFLHEAIKGLAAIAAAYDDDRTVATLSGAADAATADRPDPAIARRLDELFFARAHARLGEQAWQEAYAAGAALDADQAIEIALASVRVRAVA
jgi:predicted ATPase/DNA-binding SARP family transcriptional activator